MAAIEQVVSVPVVELEMLGVGLVAARMMILPIQLLSQVFARRELGLPAWPGLARWQTVVAQELLLWLELVVDL